MQRTRVWYALLTPCAQVFGSALTRACSDSLSGTIVVTMQLVGPASHVLLAVTHETPHATAPRQAAERERALFTRRRSSTVAPGLVDSAPAGPLGVGGGDLNAFGAAASVPANVGIAALPPHLAKQVLAALAQGACFDMGGPGAAVGFRMHSIAPARRTPTPSVSSPSGGMHDLEPLGYGQRVSLPASSQIASALGGYVGLLDDAAATAATQFWLLLPVKDLDNETNVAARYAEAPLGDVSESGPVAMSAATAVVMSVASSVVIESAIVVDDEATLRRLAERMVVHAGLRCVALEDGSELAEAIEPGTGLVLLDIVMKRSDGVQVRVARSRVRVLR
jgi:hypothetical protein